MGVASSERKGSQTTKIAAILTVVASLVLVAAFFLPYASAVDEYREALMATPDTFVSEEAGITAADATDLSLFEYARVYLALGELVTGSSTFATFYVAITVSAAAFAALTLLFALLRKPVPTIVFCVLTMAVTLLLNWDFEDRGVIPSSTYDWGIARWVYLAAGVVAAACAVWQIALRRQARREVKSA